MTGETLLSQLRRDFSSVLCHKKVTPSQDLSNTPLRRCLNLLDLTLLSVGSIIGSGIFVLAGISIHDQAGPAFILSFLIAAVPTVIAALCFAEFGARVPKAGSTYDYVYLALGEFWAALTGWYLVSGPVFTGAFMARAWSMYFDTMFDGRIANWTMENVGEINVPYMAPYPDFFAAGLILVMGVIVASGAKCSALFNNIFAIIKLLVIAFIIGYGLSFADGSNWTNQSIGGFMPFGFAGVMTAAPSAFFSYSGFEQACAAGEEAKNPVRDIVLAIGISFLISAAVYILMCSTLTLMIPYHAVSTSAAFADAFATRGAYWAKYVVAVGALSALTNVLFGCMFPIPRYLYSMASDGLMFRWLAVVNKRTKVPVRAIAICCVIAIAVMLLFDIAELVDFLSMGGLLSYSLVAASVVVIRYRPVGKDPNSQTGLLKEKYRSWRLGAFLDRYPGGSVVTVVVAVEAALMVVCSAAMVYGPWREASGLLFGLYTAFVVLLMVILLAMQFLIWAFIQNDDEQLWFRVPLVPFLPAVCMFVNILIVLNLKPITWLRFGIYTSIGLIIYGAYGIRNSIHRQVQVHPVEEKEIDESKEITKF